MSNIEKQVNNFYRGGSTPADTNCGIGRCPANTRLIKILHYEKNKKAYKDRANARPAEKKRQYRSVWKQKNTGLVNADTARRKKHISLATPKWLTPSQVQQIKDIYIEAANLTNSSGIPHQVDHIIPLRGKSFSGLHVPWNLQILTAEQNQKKNNRLQD